MGKRFVAVISFVFAACFATNAAFAACAEDEVRIAGDFGELMFSVSVVETPAEQSRGLMFVEEMGDFQGMLFVYGRPRSVSFWMRNTLISLDMIFLDESGTIQKIHERAIPLDETSIFGGSNIKFVLEVNGGIAERFGLEVGNVMQHPSIGVQAIFACTTN